MEKESSKAELTRLWMLGTFGSLALVAPLPLAISAAPKEGYTSRVVVSESTRIDWVFTAATQSPAKPPTKFLPSQFGSTKHGYELFLPPRKDTKKPLPAILFISAGDEPQGWKTFEKPCKDSGVAFIGVCGAGNGVAGPLRNRIVLDCFDDVRRQVPLDADRTYIAGFSGGGRTASRSASPCPSISAASSQSGRAANCATSHGFGTGRSIG